MRADWRLTLRRGTGRTALWPRLSAGSLALAVLALSWMPPFGAADGRAEADDRGVAAVVERYRARIPELMAEQRIPGLALTIVDGDEVLWTEAFGTLERGGTAPVGTDTLFSVQSTSKLFTATAVMVAVQSGLVDLDEPITTYLSEFTVNSAFEDHPERRITPRMLLSHTAGFTHEAPVGNNTDLEPGTWPDHLASISDTWLRFPVGSGYAYSNLGIDLAGAILERVYDLPLAEVMRRNVLDPIGMERSTFDRAEIRGEPNRALGHVAPMPEVPVDVGMTAAGGLYSSADDLGRFLRFQLEGGTIDGRRVLEPELMAEMRTIPEPNVGDTAGYALGVSRTRWVAGRNADLFSHGGGGFGFLADFWFLPQLRLGIALLTNSADHDLQGDLALSILHDITQEPGSRFEARLDALPQQSPPIEPNGRFVPPPRLRDLVADAAMPASSDQADRWERLAGVYRPISWGLVSPADPNGRFLVEDGGPWFETNETGLTVRYRLAEIAPSLFLADDGEVLDLRGAVPTWRNMDLVRSHGGPAAWQSAVLVGAAALAVAWLLATTWWAIARWQRRRTSPTAGKPRTGAGLRRLAWLIGGLTAVGLIASVGLVVVAPGLVDSGFVGWLDLPMAMRIALHLPLATSLLAVCLVGITAIAWRRRWWSGIPRIAFAALAAAAVLVVVQLGAWRLIGWGFG